MLSRWLAVGASGQAHREHRALARLARHGHIATHHARELARDGKAEPRAATAARGEGIGLGEILKQLRLLLRRHADAAIRDRELEPAAFVCHLPSPQCDFALLVGVLTGDFSDKLTIVLVQTRDKAAVNPR